MKNVDELYKDYYGVYKSDHDTNDELTGEKLWLQTVWIRRYNKQRIKTRWKNGRVKTEWITKMDKSQGKKIQCD